MPMKLFYSKISPAARAVDMVLKAFKITDVDVTDVNILSKRGVVKELRDINPQKTVPTLVDDQLVLWDSQAIVSYLANKYGFTNPNLYPTHVNKRAIVDARLHFNSGVLHPVIERSIFPVIHENKREIRGDDYDKIHRAYELSEAILKKDTWIAGTHMTIADLCCVASLTTLGIIAQIDENQYPSLARYIRRFQQLPYYNKCNREGLICTDNVIRERLMRKTWQSRIQPS